MQSETPFAFAGLWDEWQDAEGKAIRSYTILTTEANPLLKAVHDRMPVILKPESVASWLDPGMALSALVQMFESLS